MRFTLGNRNSVAISRGLRHIAGIILTAVMLSTAGTASPAPVPCIDVALVLSIDGSGSVSPGEYLFQQIAIAAAVRNQEVQRVMKQAGTVAISAVFWGTSGAPIDETPWAIIQTSVDAEHFAKWVEHRPRKVTGDTGLGAGLFEALTKFASLGACTRRSIINVSGDGRETITSRRERPFPRPEKVKAQAEAMNVIINALVISNEEENLAQYYAERIITGPGAFVMEIATYDDYAEALKRKLIREIGPIIVSRVE